MDIVKDVKEILKLQSHHEKRSQIEQISDVFEYWPDLSEKDVAEGAQLLLAAALQEEDEDLQESLCNYSGPLSGHLRWPSKKGGMCGDTDRDKPQYISLNERSLRRVMAWREGRHEAPTPHPPPPRPLRFVAAQPSPLS